VFQNLARQKITCANVQKFLERKGNEYNYSKTLRYRREAIKNQDTFLLNESSHIRRRLILKKRAFAIISTAVQNQILKRFNLNELN